MELKTSFFQPLFRCYKVYMRLFIIHFLQFAQRTKPKIYSQIHYEVVDTITQLIVLILCFAKILQIFFLPVILNLLILYLFLFVIIFYVYLVFQIKRLNCFKINNFDYTLKLYSPIVSSTTVNVEDISLLSWMLQGINFIRDQFYLFSTEMSFV